MGLNSLLKLVILAVVFPAQVNLSQPSDYEDAWEKLDEVVSSIVEEVEQPSNEEITEMAPIDEISKSDEKRQ